MGMFAGVGQERVRRKRWLLACLPGSRCSAEAYLPSRGGFFQKRLNESEAQAPPTSSLMRNMSSSLDFRR